LFAGIALIALACTSVRVVRIPGQTLTVREAKTGNPVPGVAVEVQVFRLDTMAVEETRSYRGDEAGHVRIAEVATDGYALGGKSVAAAPRASSTWIRGTGRLPLHVGTWAIRDWLTRSPGGDFVLHPAATAEALPREVVFRVETREREGLSIFVPATRPEPRIGGSLALGLLGVAAYRPLGNEFAQCDCVATIAKKLDGARLVPSLDARTGPFVDWPDRLMVRLAFEDGGDVGAWLIGEGLALVDVRFDHERRAEYERLENEAAKAGRGVWGVLKALGK
jgi:hypothetical protein